MILWYYLYPFKNCYHLAPSSSSHLLQKKSYIYLILKLKRDLELTGFVLVPGATMRSLMKNFGAREEDLVLMESGEVHHRVARDLQPAMRDRQTGCCWTGQTTTSVRPRLTDALIYQWEILLPALRKDQRSTSKGNQIKYIRSKNYWYFSVL